MINKARNAKIGPIHLSKTEIDWVLIQQINPCWFHVCGYDVIF